MADPADTGAATAPESTPQDPPETGELTAAQRKAVEAADKPDEVREIISAASRRARQAESEAKAARQELQALQDAGKSELEKAATRAERAEARAAELERAVLVGRVAGRHKIPAEHQHRLVGSTEEELDTDAKALAKLLHHEEPPPDLGSGPRETATAGAGSRGFSDRIRQQAQRRR